MTTNDYMGVSSFIGGAMKHFYDSKDVMKLLSLNSIRTAQLRIKGMNEELKSKGFWIERGKIPISFFHEKYPFIEMMPIQESRSLRKTC
ncbi:hypothetical protein [Brevibacillus laterosporus]|uniref:hypothetical protein n=1 Tax=Brevibacillus laterosporus TaxID=1465 RepID=UPI003D205604